jgi:hypothetical protein
MIHRIFSMLTPKLKPSQKIEHSSIQESKIQQGQAERDLTQIQADKLTQTQFYISLFGNPRSIESEQLWLNGLYHRFGHREASSPGEGLAKTWGHTGL